MVSKTADCLNITEPYEYDNSIEKINYMSIEPPTSINLNVAGSIPLTINPTSDWLNPSESWLNVEGRLVKADGTPYTKTANGDFSDVTLINNAILFLFNTVRYTLNDVEIENFTNPGITTLIKGLLTKQKTYTGNALDHCWAPDTYNGGVNIDYYYYPTPEIAAGDMVTAGANPTKDEYRAIMKLIIPAWNNANNIDSPNVEDVMLPCVGANPTVAEINKGFRDGKVYYVSGYRLENPFVPPVVVTEATSIALKAAVNQQIKLINAYLVSYLTPNYINERFRARKDYLFNIFDDVVPKENAGYFSFNIPLSFIFNFCEQYTKVIYNCKHEITLTRDQDSYAIYKYWDVPAGKVILSKMKWYMPKVIPNLAEQQSLNSLILSGTQVDLTFMNKKMAVVDNVMPNATTFPISLTYSSGIEKPRYIVVGFQYTRTKMDIQNMNNAIFNNPTPQKIPDVGDGAMINVNNVRVYINGDLYQLNDFYNNFTNNTTAAWYNEFKKFRVQFNGDFDQTGCVSYQDFINLYRLYVFDISKQSETITNGIANVKLDFSLNSPIPATGNVKAYCVSFFDRLWKLASDGTKQYVIK